MENSRGNNPAMKRVGENRKLMKKDGSGQNFVGEVICNEGFPTTYKITGKQMGDGKDKRRT